LLAKLPRGTRIADYYPNGDTPIQRGAVADLSESLNRIHHITPGWRPRPQQSYRRRRTAMAQSCKPAPQEKQERPRRGAGLILVTPGQKVVKEGLPPRKPKHVRKAKERSPIDSKYVRTIHLKNGASYQTRIFTNWSDEHVELVVSCVRKGEPYSKIAKRVGREGRGAIAGLVSRLRQVGML
jgi:hypothetical protein